MIFQVLPKRSKNMWDWCFRSEIWLNPFTLILNKFSFSIPKQIRDSIKICSRDLDLTTIHLWFPVKAWVEKGKYIYNVNIDEVERMSSDWSDPSTYSSQVLFLAIRLLACQWILNQMELF